MCSGFLRVPRVSRKLPVSSQDSQWVLLSQAYFCSAVAFHTVVSFKIAVILAIKNQSWDVVWICLHLLGLWQSNAWKSSTLSVTKLLFQHAVLCQKLHNLINWIQTEQKYYFKLINGKLKKNANEKCSRMFGHSKVLLVELFKDSQLLVWTRSLAAGLRCNTELMVPCCILLFSSLKGYAHPELTKIALKKIASVYGNWYHEDNKAISVFHRKLC